MDEVEKIKKKMMDEMMEEASEDGGSWPSSPVNLTDQDFEKFVTDYELSVIDCWAPWCGPCKMVAPIVDDLTEELQGKVAFGKLNTDNNQATARKFDIRAIPTLLVFKEGEMVDRLVGALPKGQIMQNLKQHM